MNDPVQAASYRPDTPIAALADWIGDPVEAADFPETTLRWRNDRAARTVGLAELSDADWVRHFGRFDPVPGNLPQVPSSSTSNLHLASDHA